MKNKILLLAALLTAVVGLAFFPGVSQAGLFGFGSRTQPPAKNELTLYALDVGQGDSFLFVFPSGQTMLIDAGLEEAGDTVVDFLKSLGLEKIDYLVATHPHADHMGGMQAVLANFDIGQVWDSGFATGSPFQRKFYAAIKRHGIPFGTPKRGYTRKIGDVLVEVLAPVRELRGTRRDQNNNCLVLMVTYGGVKFLMAADMEREERATLPEIPRCTVLKLAHHGSYNGTDKKLLRDTSPVAAIISYAKDNDYGYPHREVVKALRDLRIMRFDTADGTLKFSTDGKRLTYDKNREVNGFGR